MLNARGRWNGCTVHPPRHRLLEAYQLTLDFKLCRSFDCRFVYLGEVTGICAHYPRSPCASLRPPDNVDALLTSYSIAERNLPYSRAVRGDGTAYCCRIGDYRQGSGGCKMLVSDASRVAIKSRKVPEGILGFQETISENRMRLRYMV